MNKYLKMITNSITIKKSLYILCAAVYFKTPKKYPFQPKNIKKGFVITGYRHGECYTLLQILSPSLLDVTIDKNIQGFLTSDNRFVTREQAAKIAYKAKQVDRLWDGLISEHLY